MKAPQYAALATLGLHLLIAAVVAMPGQFGKYTVAAEQHLAGELPSERLMDLSPLYFELAVTVTRLTAAAGFLPRPEAILAALQLLLVAAAAGFLASLLERRFSRRLAMLGVAVFAVDRHVLVYERVLEPEALALFLLLGWIFFVEQAVRDGERGPRPALVAGLLAAASLATRPTFLPLALLVPLYLRTCDRRHWLRMSAAFLAPVAMVFLLLGLRAAAITGDPRTPVMNPGTVFYEGNQALSRGTSAIYPPVVRALMKPGTRRPDVAHEHYRTVARAAAGQELSIAEVNAYWSGLAVDYIRAEPKRFTMLLRDKLVRIFHAYRWHDVPTAWKYDIRLGRIAVPFALLSALAFLGLMVELERPRAAFLFYMVLLLQAGVMLAFYGSARQRLVLVPVFIYFALAALERFGRGERKFLFPAFLALSMLTVCFLLPSDAIRDDRYVRRGEAAAETLLAELSAATASEPMAAHTDLALEAVRHAPWVEWVPAYFPQDTATFDEQLAERILDAGQPTASARLDLAVVLLRARRLDEAAQILGVLVSHGRNMYRGPTQASDPRYYLARVEALRGERERALELLGEALREAPGDPFVLADLLALSDDPGLQETLSRGTGVIDAQYLLGRALLFHGRPREAASAFGFVVERLPEFRTAQIYLAAALNEAGRVDEAAARYLAAVRNEPDPLLLSVRVSELFRRWAELHPGDARVALLAGHVLHEHGRFAEALRVFESVRPPASMRPAFDEEARRVRRALGRDGRSPSPD